MDGISTWFIVLIIGFLSVLFSIIGFYMYVAFLMFKARSDREEYTEGRIIMMQDLEQDVEHTLEVSSISQFSSETARGLVALAILAPLTAMCLLFVTILSSGRFSTLTYTGLNTVSVMNSFAYVSLALVGICPTATPIYPGGQKRRNFNDIICCTIRDKITRVFHIIGASTYLFLAPIATIWFCASHDVFRGFLIAYSVQLVYNVIFVFTQGLSAVLPMRYNWAWIMVEAFAFANSSVLYACFQLYLLFEDYTRNAKLIVT